MANIIRKAGSIISAFNFALSSKDIRLAEALLPRIEAQDNKETYIDKAVAQVAAMGSRKAADILKAEWDWIIANLSKKQQYEEIGSYISYCCRVDCEPEEEDFVFAVVTPTIAACLFIFVSAVVIPVITKRKRDCRIEFVGCVDAVCIRCVSTIDTVIKMHPNKFC